MVKPDLDTLVTAPADPPAAGPERSLVLRRRRREGPRRGCWTAVAPLMPQGRSGDRRKVRSSEPASPPPRCAGTSSWSVPAEPSAYVPAALPAPQLTTLAETLTAGVPPPRRCGKRPRRDFSDRNHSWCGSSDSLATLRLSAAHVRSLQTACEARRYSSTGRPRPSLVISDRWWRNRHDHPRAIRGVGLRPTPPGRRPRLAVSLHHDPDSTANPNSWGDPPN
jgi:hypothetical protein